MFRRVFLLNGLAIVAVVFNHATIWGEIAMFWWADRYRPVVVPNFDLDATLPYYLLLLERKLSLFGVPAFLFFSGFFLNYAASGSGSGLSWKTVRARVVALLIPYALWFVIWILREGLHGVTYAPLEYVSRLLLGWPVGAYWYIPTIISFYIIAPFLVPLARAKPLQLLGAAVLLHLVYMGFAYAQLGQQLVATQSPGVEVVAQPAFPLHIHLVLYFVLGLVVGAHRKEVEVRLKGRAWYLFAAVLVLGALALVEAETVYRATNLDWRSATNTLPTSLYALAVIACFLAIPDIPKMIAQVSHSLAAKMLGIYFLHGIFLELLAKATQKYVPGLLGYMGLFQLMLVVAAVGGAWLLMEAVSRSPVRKYYKYVFG